MIPDPSPMTNPSRVMSYGRDAPVGSSLRRDNACIASKDARHTGWVAASVPPATTTSARPSMIMRYAVAIASAPDAHADTGACAPALAPISSST